MPKVIKLPSGKTMMQYFDAAGELRCESHRHANLLIRLTFTDGRRRGEMYFGDGRLISRDTYEQRRQQYPDMPAADPSVTDQSAEEFGKAEGEQNEKAEAAMQLGWNASKLTESDLFCAMVMQRGRRANAVEWIQSPEHTLGEMDHAASRRLVGKLSRLGAVAIYACEIDSYGGGENTGHLVVELPEPSSARTALFKEVARLARKRGDGGDADTSQRFAYLKLD